MQNFYPVAKIAKITGISERTIRRKIAALPPDARARHTRAGAAGLLVSVHLFSDTTTPPPPPPKTATPPPETGETEFLRALVQSQQNTIAQLNTALGDQVKTIAILGSRLKELQQPAPPPANPEPPAWLPVLLFAVFLAALFFLLFFLG